MLITVGRDAPLVSYTWYPRTPGFQNTVGICYVVLRISLCPIKCWVLCEVVCCSDAVILRFASAVSLSSLQKTRLYHGVKAPLTCIHYAGIKDALLYLLAVAGRVDRQRCHMYSAHTQTWLQALAGDCLVWAQKKKFCCWTLPSVPCQSITLPSIVSSKELRCACCIDNWECNATSTNVNVYWFSCRLHVRFRCCVRVWCHLLLWINTSSTVRRCLHWPAP